MKIQDIVLGILVAMLWGGNFVAAKYGIIDLSPLLLNSIRFFLIAVILLPFVQIPKGHMRKIFLLSITLGFGHFALLFAALANGLDIATTVVTGQLSVPFSCLLSAVVLGDVIGKWRGLGLLISFSGILLIAGTPDAADNFPAFLMVVGAALCWGFSNLIMKRMEAVPIMSTLGWMGLFTAPQLLIVSMLIERDIAQQLQHFQLRTAFSLAYTVIFSTLVAYGSWYYLLRKYPISYVAPFMLLIPLFAGALGIIVFGEVLSALKITGAALTIIGVAIIVIRRPKIAVQEV